MMNVSFCRLYLSILTFILSRCAKHGTISCATHVCVPGNLANHRNQKFKVKKVKSIIYR